ncbi:MAG: GxxExxY protein [Candidatus Magasanikbacteria bacterium]|jgi:GxxExxY protein|nr:GxxExxY protein [Candidatus Magasanikbacteria bacterium]MBT4314696.1 GxxExxY protein [Candidatus Magasanikbacteria bacterium]MBT4547473.1 GxxExxY protein [Candidatus Magasanikbacteria bacterium]
MKLKESKLTGQIIKVAIEIHKELGPGFKEEIYHQAMIIGLEKESLEFETEKEFDVYYKDNLIGTFRADLVIEDKIIVELKALSGDLPSISQTQTVTYLKASKLEIGLLINFGNPIIGIKRLVNFKNYQR